MALLEKCRVGGSVRRHEEREERRREAVVLLVVGRRYSPVREVMRRFSCSTARVGVLAEVLLGTCVGVVMERLPPIVAPVARFDLKVNFCLGARDCRRVESVSDRALIFWMGGLVEEVRGQRERRLASE
jgi:hypothetical protein